MEKNKTEKNKTSSGENSENNSSSYSGFFSFADLLEKYLREKNPSKILEWGPGKSTELILKTCPQANIVSIEHDDRWYEKYKEDYKDYKNLKLIKQKIKGNCEYVTIAYNYAPYDLVFIDGRRRVECAIVALSLVKEQGVIILHDADRTNYTKPLSPFIEVLEKGNRTIVFRPKKQ